METWLNPNKASDNISLISFHHPERKNRIINDSHGGVIVYINDHIHFVRRRDLEQNRVKCDRNMFSLGYYIYRRVLML